MHQLSSTDNQSINQSESLLAISQSKESIRSTSETGIITGEQNRHTDQDLTDGVTHTWDQSPAFSEERDRERERQREGRTVGRTD